MNRKQLTQVGEATLVAMLVFVAFEVMLYVTTSDKQYLRGLPLVLILYPTVAILAFSLAWKELNRKAREQIKSLSTTTYEEVIPKSHRERELLELLDGIGQFYARREDTDRVQVLLKLTVGGKIETRYYASLPASKFLSDYDCLNDSPLEELKV